MGTARSHAEWVLTLAVLTLLVPAALTAAEGSIDLRILGAHDFIVPESSLNACQVRFDDPRPRARATLVVENRHAERVRSFPVRPSSRMQLVLWDGCDRDGAPLPEERAPYAYRLLARGPDGTEHRETLGGIGLRSWGIAQNVIDPPKDGFASGIDVATITPDLVKLMLSVDGGPRWIARHLDVEEVEKGATIRPLHSDGRPFQVYTTPTPSIGLPTITYLLTTIVLPGGALDNVGNPFAQAGVEYTLRVMPDGEKLVMSTRTW